MTRKMSLTGLIESTVGPAPWYWKTFPNFERDGESLRWRFYGTTSKLAFVVVLEEPGVRAKPLLAVNTYMRPFVANPGYLGLWYPVHNGGRLEVTVFDLAQMRPIEGFTEKASRFKESRDSLLHSSPVAEQVRIPDQLPAGVHQGLAASRADTLAELFLIADAPPAQSDDPSAPETSIYVWHPATGEIQVLPQEWLTAAEYDIGYQWITRVTRDPETGHIIGDGIRLSQFELDDNGTRLLRTL